MPKIQEQNSKTSTLAKRLVHQYLKRYVGLLGSAIFFMLVAAGMTAVAASLLQPVLDDVLYGGKKDMIYPVALGVFITFVLRGTATYLHTVLINRVGQNVVADIQHDLFNNFMTLDMAFFHANSSGHLISRVTNDVNVLRSIVAEGLTGLGKNLFTLIFLITLMVYQDWKLSLIVFSIFPIISGSVLLIGKKLRKVSKNIQNEQGTLSALLSQTFQGVRLIKAYGMEEIEKERVGRRITKVRDLNIKSVRLSNLSGPINEIVVGIIFSGLIVYGGNQVLTGHVTAGSFASFLAAFALTFDPMRRMAKLNNAVQVALGAAERVFDMIDHRPEITNSAAAHELDSRRPEISFEDVKFQYENTEMMALKGVSFTAPSGKMTALVGPSGSGKSTIINMIMRFYDVQDGVVRINGTDVRDLKIESLRSHIALVSQDITIFDDTILENIKFGNRNASEQEIMQAAIAAAADDFIHNLPQGYQTVVGEHGVKLSGGQKQRISIARAILRDAPILLLDEATSALDNESEMAVQTALKELEKGRTTIVIAHRLTTVQEADQILVMDHGCVLEQGTHAQLMAQNGAYEKMYRMGLRE